MIDVQPKALTRLTAEQEREEEKEETNIRQSRTSNATNVILYPKMMKRVAEMMKNHFDHDNGEGKDGDKMSDADGQRREK